MNYWNNVFNEVRENLAARPTVHDYNSEVLFERWVRNLGETGRGVVCSAAGVSSAPYCKGN